MRLYGSSATISKAARRHAHVHRPAAAFDAPRTRSRRVSERRVVDQARKTPVPKLVPRSV